MDEKKEIRAIGYARVSTETQGADGLGMHAQRTAIETSVLGRGWTLVGIEEDVASGKSTDGRPGLLRALDRVEAGQADALVVAKLDRLARSVVDGGQILKRAAEKGWLLVVTDLGLDTSTPMGKFGAHILLAAAELERSMISERTKAARAELVRQGKPVGGRPKGSWSIPDEVRQRIVAERRGGSTFTAIARGLDADGIKPARADHWHVETVRKVVFAHLGEVLEPAVAAR
jgi:DNA invertase Pin-like site-specific DNA recombinase